MVSFTASQPYTWFTWFRVDTCTVNVGLFLKEIVGIGTPSRRAVGVHRPSAMAFVPPSVSAPYHARVRIPARSSAAPAAPADAAVAVARRLNSELPSLFSKPVDTSMYAADVAFADPLNSHKGAEPYKSNIEFLGGSAVFEGADMRLLDVGVVGGVVRTRWVLGMVVRFLPWKPRVDFTGISEYFVRDDGLIEKHVDYWDSIRDNDYFSWEAVRDLVKQCAPASGQRAGELVRRGAMFEVRRGEAGIVAVARVEGDVAALEKDLREWAVGEARCVLAEGPARIVERPQGKGRELWVPCLSVDVSVGGVSYFAPT